MTGIVAWIVFGLLAGAVARMLHPGKDPGGWVLTILIGIAGAVLGGWIGTRLGWGDITGWNLRSFLLAVGGSVLLLWLYRMLRGRE